MTWILGFIFMMPLLITQGQIVNKELLKNSGIRWIEGLTWQQVKEKAKAENKYIFMDVYATWCGPCKLMDKEVYSNDTLGGYFDQHFISVKVQTDQTKKDNEYIRSWYSDANVIRRQYHIESYPSFVFLSPVGVVVEKQTGYKSVQELISIAQSATQPGKVYNDPYAEFEMLLADYRKGIKRMDRMPYMIKAAQSLEEFDLFKQLVKEYTDYCMTLPPEQRYTKDNIEMWATYLLSSKTRAFNLFYRDSEIIDKIMNKKGYAAAVVDRTIMDEIVFPFLIAQNRDSSVSMAGGMTLSGPGLKANYQEADWENLYRKIRKAFNTAYAKRNVLQAKIHWYERNRNYIAFAKYCLQYLKEYPPDLTDEREATRVNSTVWNIFMYTTDRQLVDEAIRWTRRLVDQNLNTPFKGMVMDTYANLLYKAGRTAEAIQWEEMAISDMLQWDNKEASEAYAKLYRKVIGQMKRGEPTHGAAWGYH